MPFNSGGVFSRLYNWVTDAGNSIPMTAARFDADANDMAAGLSQCMTRNGQSPATANLPMGGYKLTNVAAGTAAGDAINYTQLTSTGVGLGADLLGYLQGGTGATARTAQAKMRDIVSVMDFGAAGNGSTDDTAAIQAGNTYAAANGKTLYFPAPTVAYVYSPAAAINIATAWLGASQYSVIINVANSYAGEVFRLLPSSSMEGMTIQTPGLSKTAGSIGVRVSAVTTGAQCVNVDMRRVFIRGFAINLDHQNSYVFHADHVHIESGTEGIYCVPDSTGGLGFITTHTYVNCDIGNNVRDVYYAPPNYSNTVTFVGGNISGSTGTNQQAFFTRVRVLKFINTYFETSPTIKALALGDVAYVSVDGAYFNGTGGISLGNLSQAEFKNVWCTTGTDVVTGADGSQLVSFVNCLLPGAGNSLPSAWKFANLQQTFCNNVFYGSATRGLSVGFKDNQQTGGGTQVLDLNNGSYQRIFAIDATAFAVGAPTNAVAGMMFDLTIQNSAGSAIGAITWNAVFKLAGTFTNPAAGNNRTISFMFDGATWHEKSRTAADAPN